jgi:hypothetical protein
MTKVAKLVEVSLLVRIIIDENATEDQIAEATYPKLQDKLNNREVGDNIVSVEDDTEVPFGDAPDDITGEESFEERQPRMHFNDGDFCTSCGTNVTGEQHKCKPSIIKSCDTCSLGQEGNCELNLTRKCVTFTNNIKHGDYWIDKDEE